MISTIVTLYQMQLVYPTPRLNAKGRIISKLVYWCLPSKSCKKWRKTISSSTHQEVDANLLQDSIAGIHKKQQLLLAETWLKRMVLSNWLHNPCPPRWEIETPKLTGTQFKMIWLAGLGLWVIKTLSIKEKRVTLSRTLNSMTSLLKNCSNWSGVEMEDFFRVTLILIQNT